jgi:hypothetical protein
VQEAFQVPLHGCIVCSQPASQPYVTSRESTDDSMSLFSGHNDTLLLSRNLSFVPLWCWSWLLRQLNGRTHMWAVCRFFAVNRTGLTPIALSVMASNETYAELSTPFYTVTVDVTRQANGTAVISASVSSPNGLG